MSYFVEIKKNYKNIENSISFSIYLCYILSMANGGCPKERTVFHNLSKHSATYIRKIRR